MVDGAERAAFALRERQLSEQLGRLRRQLTRTSGDLMRANSQTEAAQQQSQQLLARLSELQELNAQLSAARSSGGSGGGSGLLRSSLSPASSMTGSTRAHVSPPVVEATPAADNYFGGGGSGSSSGSGRAQPRRLEMREHQEYRAAELQAEPEPPPLRETRSSPLERSVSFEMTEEERFEARLAARKAQRASSAHCLIASPYRRRQQQTSPQPQPAVMQLPSYAAGGRWSSSGRRYIWTPLGSRRVCVDT